MNNRHQKIGFFDRTERFFQKLIPSRQLLIKTNGKTHFINLKSSTQVGFSAIIFSIFAWSIISLAIVVMDSLGAGNFREQALRDKENYQSRLMYLAEERDFHVDLSRQAQIKFDEALGHISFLQEAIMEGEIQRKELSAALILLKNKLNTSRIEEKIAKSNLSQLKQVTNLEAPINNSPGFLRSMETGKETLLAKVLSETAEQRDFLEDEAVSARLRVKNIEREMKLIEQRNEQIFRLIEEALSVSVGPLDKMFRSAGVNPEGVIKTIRQSYQGYGGHNLSFLDGDGETAFVMYDKNLDRASRFCRSLRNSKAITPEVTKRTSWRL